jgi:hypothetical protein
VRSGQGASWRGAARLARQAAGLPVFLRTPLELSTIAATVTERVRDRNLRFLRNAQDLIYSRARHPLRRLLLSAGCEFGDLQSAVRRDGLETTLERLAAAGVKVRADELRGRVPLERNGLELRLTPEDFANPRVRSGVRGTTSGTTTQSLHPPRRDRESGAGPGAGRSAPGARVMVSYSWAFLAEEAADEHLLLATHGLVDAPLVLWMPRPPGIASLHNLLVHAKLGRPPLRWFSPSPAPEAAAGLAHWTDRGWRLARRFLPALGPGPEWVPPDRADEIARWLASAPRPAVVKCFTTSALRIAAAARAEGLDLSGQICLAGGEPLNEARRRFLEQAGLRTFARYAATETGFLGGACPESPHGADMHLFADRVALINTPGTSGSGPVAVTTLSSHAPLVLLNVELGDHARLRRAPCSCVLGQAGLEWRVSDVESPEKIAAEGLKLGTVDFTELVAAVVYDLGGAPDDFQICLEELADGATRPTVAISPESSVAPAEVRTQLRRRLGDLPGGALASDLWLDTGALRVEHRPLVLGAGFKTQRVVRRAGSEVPDGS